MLPLLLLLLRGGFKSHRRGVETLGDAQLRRFVLVQITPSRCGNSTYLYPSLPPPVQITPSRCGNPSCVCGLPNLSRSNHTVAVWKRPSISTVSISWSSNHTVAVWKLEGVFPILVPDEAVQITPSRCGNSVHALLPHRRCSVQITPSRCGNSPQSSPVCCTRVQITPSRCGNGSHPPWKRAGQYVQITPSRCGNAHSSRLVLF